MIYIINKDAHLANMKEKTNLMMIEAIFLPFKFSILNE